MFNFQNYKIVASFRRHVYEGFITLEKKDIVIQIIW